MTKEEKLNILNQVEDRTYEELGKFTPGAFNAKTILDFFCILFDARQERNDLLGIEGQSLIRAAGFESVSEMAEEAEAQEEPVVEETPVADAAPSEDPYGIPDDPKPTEEPKAEVPETPAEELPSKEEVRTVLAAISAEGGITVVQSIFKELGVARLSEVDPTDYPKLMKLAEEAKA